MKVSLQGAPINSIAIPRFAMHENQVYVITKKNRLKRITLTNLQYQGDLVLTNSSLQQGDKIITSDVFPAVDGMQLIPIIDDEANKRMQAWLGAAQ